MNNEEYNIGDVQDLLQGAIMSTTRHFVISEGIIDAVSEDGVTCDVDISGATFYDVPVKVLADEELPRDRPSLLEKPTVGSKCLLMFRDGNLQRPQLFMMDKADVQYNDIPQVIFHGGKLGGMVVIQPTTDAINRLEAALNKLIGIFNQHTHVSGAQGSPTGPPTPTDGDHLDPTKRADLENTTITQ